MITTHRERVQKPKACPCVTINSHLHSPLVIYLFAISTIPEWKAGDAQTGEGHRCARAGAYPLLKAKCHICRNFVGGQKSAPVRAFPPEELHVNYSPAQSWKVGGWGAPLPSGLVRQPLLYLGKVWNVRWVSEEKTNCSSWCKLISFSVYWFFYLQSLGSRKEQVFLD